MTPCEQGVFFITTSSDKALRRVFLVPIWVRVMVGFCPMTTQKLNPTFQGGLYAIWLRNARVWVRQFWSSLTMNVGEPLLFLFAFGYGMGAVIDTVGGVPYLAFVLPGMVVNSTFFSGVFETTIGAFTRFYQQRTYNAILATPVRLHEIVLGEVLWAGSKGIFSASLVFTVGLVVGGILSVPQALLGLLLLMLMSPAFAATGMVFTAYAKNYNFFSYFFTFWVTPSMLFGGVFFEVSRFPDWVQWLAWILPVTHAVYVMRDLSLGHEIIADHWLHVGYVLSFGMICYGLAVRRLRQRLFD